MKTKCYYFNHLYKNKLVFLVIPHNFDKLVEKITFALNRRAVYHKRRVFDIINYTKLFNDKKNNYINNIKNLYCKSLRR
jgi:hypothetical protein